MLVIFGWLRRFTVLGVKLDACQTCGQVCEHVVGRKTNWGHLFWIPVLFLGFEHGMICTTCTTWTSIPWRSVRAAMKSGVLPLDRPRPTLPVAQLDGAPGGPPLPAQQGLFDRMLVNHKRGAWDMYLKAWPVLVALLIVVGSVSPKTAGTSSAVTPSQGRSTLYSSTEGPAHTCWEAPDGSITGCRLADGSLMGESTLLATTCYFTEPLPATATTLSCRD